MLGFFIYNERNNSENGKSKYAFDDYYLLFIIHQNKFLTHEICKMSINKL